MQHNKAVVIVISTHALREEGDRPGLLGRVKSGVLCLLRTTFSFTIASA